MKKQINAQLQRFQKNNQLLGHSFLVSGPKYTGRLSLVLEAINRLNGVVLEKPEDILAGSLPDLLLVRSEGSFDFKEWLQEQATITRENSVADAVLDYGSGKKNNKKSGGKTIGREQLAPALHQIQMKNWRLRYKVLIIQEAERLNLNAANSLLKLIEEPPPRLLIFLITGNEKEILPTIRSRCEKIKFTLTGEEKLRALLMTEFNLKDEEVKSIISLAGGRVELARFYAQCPECRQIAEMVRSDFRQALRGNKLEKLKFAEMVTQNKELLISLIDEWLWYLKSFLEQQIKKGAGLAVLKKVEGILENLLVLQNKLRKSNANARIQLENFFIQL